MLSGFKIVLKLYKLKIAGKNVNENKYRPAVPVALVCYGFIIYTGFRIDKALVG